MNFKGSYRGTVKALKSKQIKDFQSLTANLKRFFPAAPQPYDLYYYDGSDFINLADQDDFESIPEDIKKIKIIIKSEDYDINRDVSYLDETLKSVGIQINNSGIKDVKLANQSQRESIKKQQSPNRSSNIVLPKQFTIEDISQTKPQRIMKKRIEEPAQITSEEKKRRDEQFHDMLKTVGQITEKMKLHQGKKMKEQPRSIYIPPKKEQLKIKVQAPVVEKDQKNEQSKIKSEAPIVEKEKKRKSSRPVSAIRGPFTHAVACNKCKSKNILGTRWKCKQCYDYDLCEGCYSSKYHQNDAKTKNHEFYEIKNDQFWKKINYLHAIKKLFNPEYVQPENDNMAVKEWIKEEDITNNSPIFVKEVWNASEPIIKKFTADFQKWSQQYQAKNGKK